MTASRSNFRRDPTIYDGRFANNGWLQELPKPMTKLTWDNAALIAPGTAERLGVENGDMIVVEHGPAQAEHRRCGSCPATHRTASPSPRATAATSAGRLGNGTGFNAYAIRGSASPWFGAATIAKTDRHLPAHGTQDHWSIEGRNIVRSANLEDFKAKPDVLQGDGARRKLKGRISLYADHEYQGRRVGHGDRHEHVHRAAWRASSPASPRTTSPSSARSR